MTAGTLARCCGLQLAEEESAREQSRGSHLIRLPQFGHDGDQKTKAVFLHSRLDLVVGLQMAWLLFQFYHCTPAQSNVCLVYRNVLDFLIVCFKYTVLFK